MTWTDTDKALWILEHGEPQVRWITERVHDRLYRRPVSQDQAPFPPWIDRARTLHAVLNPETGYFEKSTKNKKPQGAPYDI